MSRCYLPTYRTTAGRRPAPASASGVLYLDAAVLQGHLNAGPNLCDVPLRERIHQLHESLRQPGDELEAQSRFAFIRERLMVHQLVVVMKDL
jgi:hypothetical protein